MTAPKILDMRIDKVAAGWRMYIPIKTGHLELTVPFQNNDINIS